jgi:hypothetical protein
VIKRLASTIAALALLLLVAAPAMAQDLHQATPIPWNEGQFQGTEEECADANLQPGQVLWHFVGHFDTDQNLSMDATFADSQFNQTDLAPTKIVDHYEAHWDIITTQTTLLSASVTPDTDVDGFNLSHICTNPPTDVPEAPFAALLVLSAGMSALGFFALRRRRSASLA